MLMRPALGNSRFFLLIYKCASICAFEWVRMCPTGSLSTLLYLENNVICVDI